MVEKIHCQCLRVTMRSFRLVLVLLTFISLIILSSNTDTSLTTPYIPKYVQCILVINLEDCQPASPQSTLPIQVNFLGAEYETTFFPAGGFKLQMETGLAETKIHYLSSEDVGELKSMQMKLLDDGRNSQNKHPLCLGPSYITIPDYKHTYYFDSVVVEPTTAKDISLNLSTFQTPQPSTLMTTVADKHRTTLPGVPSTLDTGTILSIAGAALFVIVAIITIVIVVIRKTQQSRGDDGSPVATDTTASSQSGTAHDKDDSSKTARGFQDPPPPQAPPPNIHKVVHIKKVDSKKKQIPHAVKGGVAKKKKKKVHHPYQGFKKVFVKKHKKKKTTDVPTGTDQSMESMQDVREEDEEVEET